MAFKKVKFLIEVLLKSGTLKKKMITKDLRSYKQLLHLMVFFFMPLKLNNFSIQLNI